jgi:hypothetical protein
MLSIWNELWGQFKILFVSKFKPIAPVFLLQWNAEIYCGSDILLRIGERSCLNNYKTPWFFSPLANYTNRANAAGQQS